MKFTNMTREELEAELVRCNRIMVEDGKRIGELTEALKQVLQICENGVIQINETGKPIWHALDVMKGIAAAAIAKVKGETK